MIREAIEILKTYTDGKDNTDKVEISVMQLNRIINALEQQPTDAVDRVTIKEYMDSYNGVKTELEPCEDVINRQDATAQCFQAMKLISGEFECELSHEKKIYNAGLRKAVEVIRALPPVTPQQKMGRWIEYEVDIAPHPLHCSICGFSNHHISNRYIKEFRRCPNCGAEMEGEE